MKKVFSKIGYFFLSLLPFLIFVGTSFIVSFIATIMITMDLLTQEGIDFSNIAVVQEYLTNAVFSNLMLINSIAQILAIIAMGIWYYFGFVRVKKGNVKPPLPQLRISKLLVVAALGIMLQIAITFMIELLSPFMVELVNQYESLMKLSGVETVSVLSILSAVILAPICEELCFRGLTYRIAKKICNKWIFANIFQAALFGLAHMNWIQSTYAFFCGLIMGYIYEKYGRLWISILFHLVINGSGYLLDALMNLVPQELTGLIVIIGFVLSTFGCVACIFIIGRVKKVPSNTGVENEISNS